MSRSINTILQKTNAASLLLQAIPDRTIKKMLRDLAKQIRIDSVVLLEANKKDLAKLAATNPSADRLMLNAQRINGIAKGMEKISRLPSPSNRSVIEKMLKNGLRLQKITVPLGVIAAIYESRPNVSFDIAALCLRSGNAVVLKGSTDAAHSNLAAIKLIKAVLSKHGIPVDVVNLLPPARESVRELFIATKYVDVIIPRGSDRLIKYVRENSLVPVIETGAGVCHLYIDSEADLDMAINIAVNSKVSRPTVCNSMDTLLLAKDIAAEFLERISALFSKYEVGIYADPMSFKLLKNYPKLFKASPENFATEYLSLNCSIKIVNGLPGALKHIREFSTKHSEAIVTANKSKASLFLSSVDAAAVYHNASTRFTDGAEFGLGAEVGISTQKLHARGPFALEKLVTEKWVIRGNGQIRN